MFTIVYRDIVVRKDIPQLDRAWREETKAAIEKKLTMYPEVHGKPLRESLRGYRALRVGDYRVVFRIEKQIVKIFAILHRSIVYKEILNRLN